MNRARGVQHVWELGPKNQGNELEWLEFEGKSLTLLKEDIDKAAEMAHVVAHQMASAIGLKAARQVQSAASKVRDSVMKRLVCERYAQDVRQHALLIAQMVSLGRRDTLDWQASGLDQHDLPDIEGVARESMVVQGVINPSITGRREYAKRFWRQVLTGSDPNVLDTIEAEIDAAPPEAFMPDIPETAAVNIRE